MREATIGGEAANCGGVRRDQPDAVSQMKTSPASVLQKSETDTQNRCGTLGSWMIRVAAPVGAGRPWSPVTLGMLIFDHVDPESIET